MAPIKPSIEERAGAMLIRPEVPHKLPEAPLELGPADLVMPRVYTRVLFFYPKAPEVWRLAASVASLVVGDANKARPGPYSPWAGRLEPTGNDGSLVVVPSAEGVSIVLAASKKRLADIAGPESTYPYAAIPDGLTPVPPFASGASLPILALQLTSLACGGAVLCVALHHSVGDGGAVFGFVGDLAAAYRTEAPPRHATHDRRLVPFAPHPPQPELHPEYVLTPTLPPPTKPPPMAARFLRFAPDALASLKARAGGGSTNDALAALLWRTVTRARGVPENETVRLGMAVDGRRRAAGIPPSYAGCANFYAMAALPVGQLLAPGDEGLAATARAVRAAVQRVDSGHIAGAQAVIASAPNKAGIAPGFSSFLGKDLAITSWAGFGLPEAADLGSGVPVLRIPQAPTHWDGLAICLPAPSGALDVALGLVEEHFRRLLSDPELLSAGAAPL